MLTSSRTELLGVKVLDAQVVSEGIFIIVHAFEIDVADGVEDVGSLGIIQIVVGQVVVVFVHRLLVKLVVV